MPARVEHLHQEYASIRKELGAAASNSELVSALVEHSDWTQDGAEALVSLVKDYGVLMLSNAFALALALNIEDGARGF